MKDLYIVGAGGCGRELLSMLLDVEAMRGRQYNIKGFLDDTKSSLEDVNCPYPVAGTIADYYPKENDVLMMGIASPEGKKKLASLLKGRGARFESFIHPGTCMGHFNSIGEGVLIYGGFGMTVNVRLGNFTTMQGCYLGHDVTVGDFTTISSFCNIMGYADIGQSVFMGSNVAVVPNTRVGNGAYLCAGSVIIKDVPANSKMLGNPAREIG